MTENSPTCILSSSCLEGPTSRSRQHHHRQSRRSQVPPPLPSTISSGVAESSSGVRGSLILRSGGGSTEIYRDHNYATISSSDCQLQDEPRRHQPPARSPVLSSSPSNSRCSCSTLSNARHPAEIEKESEEESNPELLRASSQKSPRSNKISGWKTSKFFSKSMTSGDLLKGLKKLSLSSNNEDQDSKSLKTRLGNFKKRTSCGTEETTTDAEPVEKPKTPVMGDAGSQKSVQDDGIVCKKEDLKAIICSATKRIPLCSPSKKKRALRQTKSASFEPPDDKSKKEPVRRAGSEESRTRKSMPSVERDIALLTPRLEARASSISGTSSIAPIPPKSEIAKTPTVVLTKVEQPEPEIIVEPSKVEDACVSTVKWDECEVVDAVLIGDAIESFLKGSMSSSDKKVAFRKNSAEKKKS